MASTPPRSEMALLPRRCPRLLLIQIPTWLALGPFYVLLRSLQPVVFRSYFTRLSSLSGERAPHCLSFSPADVYRDSLSPARRFRGFPPSRSAKCLHRAEGSPRGSSSLLPPDNDRSWNTMDTMVGEVSRRSTIDDRWQRSMATIARRCVLSDK